MSKRTMPQAFLPSHAATARIEWDVPPQAFEKWAPNIAAAVESENTISIYDIIGIDPWTGEGTTAKRIAGILRAIGADEDVVVNINSPGGSLIEGVAIYNLLREHKGKVTVKVLGMAASAASVIAMAGDEILIGRAAFFMVHNAWIIALGNRHDLREAADFLEPFDLAMADVYVSRTGLDLDVVQKKMDAETWINGTAAVDEGWADDLLAADQIVEGKAARSTGAAAHAIDVAMAKAGIPRMERRSLLQTAFKTGTPGAAGRDGTPSATARPGTQNAADADDLLKSIESFSLEGTEA